MIRVIKYNMGRFLSVKVDEIAVAMLIAVMTEDIPDL